MGRPPPSLASPAGPGDLVAISGVGGLGHLAVQYARIFGGTVAAIDVTDEKLQLARELAGKARARIVLQP